jgi:uncharacterized protein YidB (DUF937 family)
MGMFDGLLGGIVGAGMVSVINGIIEKHGGLEGVVSQFEKNGLGATVQSWVGTGANQSISSDDVHRVIGPDLLQQLAAKSGLSVQELTQKLSQILPQAVDHLTPGGTIPKV